jgi:hypothetical protein
MDTRRVLSWLALIVAAALVGFLAVRFYVSATRPDPQAPIRIFRTPNNHDYSSIIAGEVSST